MSILANEVHMVTVTTKLLGSKSHSKQVLDKDTAYGLMSLHKCE